MHSRLKFPLTNDALLILAVLAILAISLSIKSCATATAEGKEARNGMDDPILADRSRAENLPQAFSEKAARSGLCRREGVANSRGVQDPRHRTPPDGPAEASPGGRRSLVMETTVAARLAAIFSGRGQGREIRLDAILDAIRQVENFNGRSGDAGRSRGPYQIGRAYWKDSGVKLAYLANVNSDSACRKVIVAYWRRYCPEALRHLDVRTLASVHNAGPAGLKNPNTDYARRVEALAENFLNRKD